MKKQVNVISAELFRRQQVDQAEHGLQARCLRWFKLQYPQLMLVAAPNAGRRTKAERGRLLAEGMVAGWPDLMLAYPSGEQHALFIEMKTVDGSLSDRQVIVHAYLRSVGYEVIVPRTFEEFQQGVKEYFN